MKKLIHILLFLIINCQFSVVNSIAQNFSPEEQHQIDSLNAIITNANSHDTTLARTYVNLSEILFLVNIDTVILLCERADSIVKSKLNKKISEKERVSLLKIQSDAFNNLVFVYEKMDEQNLALKYYFKSLPLLKKIGDTQKLSLFLNNIGSIYREQGEIDKAIMFFQKSIIIKKELGDHLGLAGTFNNLGALYDKIGEVNLSLKYHFLSLKIRKDINDKKGLSESLNNIGYVYSTQDDFINALKYYKKSLFVSEEIDDKIGMIYSLNNIGSIYISQNDFTNSLKYLNKSLFLSKEIDYKQGEVNSLLNIGTLYASKNKVKALEYYKKGLLISEEIDYKYGISYSLNNIGNINLTLGDIKQASKYSNRALEVSQQLGLIDIISNSAETNFKVFERQNNYKSALEMYKLHIQMRDSLNNKETQKAAAKQQAQYEYEKQKAIDDAEHEKQIAIEQEAAAKQQIITYATAGGLGLVGIFLIFVFNRLQVTKRQKNIIEEQKQEVEEQKQIVETAHHELEEKNQEILDSINYAKRIQNAILPPQKVVKEYLQESFILYKPKDIVAGDFYWLEHKEDKVLFAACDCTGHGVPGAMVSVVCNNGLNRSVREYNLTDPGKILDKTREIVIQEFEKSEEEVKDGMDIALCSLEGNTLKYAGANNPLWIIRNGEIIETKADKQPIGKFDELLPYTTHTFELQKGDSIYIFSDGYADQFGGEKGKKFKAANFKKLLLSIQKESIEQQKELINQAFEDWKGDLEQLDDVCVIGVRV